VEQFLAAFLAFASEDAAKSQADADDDDDDDALTTVGNADDAGASEPDTDEDDEPDGMEPEVEPVDVDEAPSASPNDAARFPLAIVLTAAEMRAWATFKERAGVRKDKDALLLLLDVRDEGEE
jgi:hypothetical protein